MAAPLNNQNAATSSAKRIDVHVSLADRNGHFRRSVMERLAHEKLGHAPSETELIAVARGKIYEFLDSLETSSKTS